MGLYKNRKPFCASADSFDYKNEQFKRCKDTQLTCQTDADCKWLPNSPKCETPASVRYFGDANRACEPTYFEFTHNYDCSKTSNMVAVSSLDKETKDRLYGMNLKDTNKVCVFVPKVQVLDNWGWCGGSNIDANGNITPRPEGWWNDGDEPLCHFAKIKAWTYYKGRIIVVPQ